MNRAALIKEIDELVYDLELNGVSEEDIYSAMREYLEIVAELDHVAPV